MLYSSYPYLFLFLPVVVFSFFFLSYRVRSGAALLWLLLASWVFYAWWDWRLLPLLLFTIAFNYWASGRIDRSRNRRMLIFALSVNLGLLGFFKYFDFAIENLRTLGLHVAPLNIVLPIGISFFTFQQIVFLVNSYRGLNPTCNLRDFSIIVSLFCHLVSGPIVYVQKLVPQLKNPETFKIQWHNMAKGIFLLSTGLLKKAFADQFIAWSFIPGLTEHSATFTGAWLTGLCYTIRIYFDFSAYIDMARGSGFLLNLEMPVNFDSPYKAVDFRDFWRRWNITLSSFLRDYLYIPLGGSRKPLPRVMVNLMITMLLAGLWHGAGWGFILWGGMHGLFMCLNHLWVKSGWKIPTWLSRAVTFLVVVMAWSFFKSPTLFESATLFKAMIGMNGFEIALPFGLYHWCVAHGISGMLNQTGLSVVYAGTVSGFFGFWSVISLICGLGIVFLAPNSNELSETPMFSWKQAFCTGAAFAVGVLFLFDSKDFVYFQF